MKKFLPKFNNNPQGFTLVELLVVVSIIAVLSVIGIIIFTGTQKSARDARRRADVDAISKAWESHYSNTSPRYPAMQGSWFSGGSIPADPTNSGIYVYTGTNTNADTYMVCATLENGGGNTNNGAQYCIQNQQ